MDVEMKGSDWAQVEGSVLSFHNIYYRVTVSSHLPWRRSSQRKDILTNVSGIMKPGMNAILGPTGSGKSSLLDVLADRKDPVGLAGEVLLNGTSLPRDFKFMSGYVVQDDVVMGSLTVRQNFEFSAALRLPTSVSRAEKEQRVERIISELGLTKVADSKVVVTLVLGLVVGALFFDMKLDNAGIQNRMGSLFFMITNQLFGSLSAIELFVREHKIFIHEYVSGYYRVSAYFLSKVLSDLIPMRTLPGIIFSCVTFWMIGLQARVDVFFTHMLTVVMTAYSAVGLALAVSAGTSVVAVANVFITICFIFMMLFSGFLVNLPSIMSWLSWLQYLSIPGYGFTSLLINEFTGLKFPCRDQGNATELEQCPPNSSALLGPVCTGEEHLCRLGIMTDTWSLWKNHVALASMTLILLTIAYLRLRFLRKFT